MFDITSKYDGYRLNHENFECVTETTYKVGTMIELMENDTALVHVSDYGEMCLPSFYHCGKKTELMPNSSLLDGASAFYECKNHNPPEVIVVCKKNEPVGFIGFADHIPRQCCFEPFCDEEAIKRRWTITLDSDRPTYGGLYHVQRNAYFVRDGNDSGFHFYASTHTFHDKWAPFAKHYFIYLTCTDLSFPNGDPVREKDAIITSYINGSLGGTPGRSNSFLHVETNTVGRHDWRSKTALLVQVRAQNNYRLEEDTKIIRRIGLYGGDNDIVTGVRIACMAAGVAIKESPEAEYATPYTASVSGLVKYICFEQHPDNMKQ